MGTFDLIIVKIKNESIQGRPFEWDRTPADSAGNDEAGVPITPTRYMTTCPFCAQLIKFRPEELYDDNNIKCPSCDAHTPPVNHNPEGIEMITAQTVIDSKTVVEQPAVTIAEEMANAPTPKVAIPIEDVDYPFVDPILNKSVDTSNYCE